MSGEAGLLPTGLRCEHREDVPTIDCEFPRLSWALFSEGDGKRQSAYRILVARDLDDLAAGRGSQWDSGRIASAQSIDIAYGGAPLASGEGYVWTVQVWDESGAASEFAPPSHFRTGLADWHAQWVGPDRKFEAGIKAPDATDIPTLGDELRMGPSPFLRRDFQATVSRLRQAILYFSARGLVEMHLNGRRVGDARLTPGWTDYRKRYEYMTEDVTHLIEEGPNAIGAILGDGWYAGFVGFDPRRRACHYGEHPHLLCELHLIYEDGGRRIVASDDRWRAATGPLRYADLLMGEYYDARCELDGWATAGYDDSDWGPVQCDPLDGVQLVPHRAQPVRITEELRPISVSERAPGIHVFDLGQNFAGWVRLQVQGEAGTKVTLRHAEVLEPDGSIYVENLLFARATDIYILRGRGEEVYEPRFTFHGFRYVEVSGLLGEVTPESVTGCVIGSDTPQTGTFSCSDDMIERLWANAMWSQRSNFISVPTDCPSRDERLGFLGDGQVFAPAATLNRDVAAFMTKWLDDIADGQSEDGGYPTVAPRLVEERDGSPAWGDAGIIVPWVLYLRYGDTRVLERHWDEMDRYVMQIARHNPDYLWTQRRHQDFGDWLSVGADTPAEVLATAYWAYDALLMSRIAGVLGRVEDERRYDRMRTEIVSGFNRAYVSSDGQIEGDTQTVYVLALAMGLLDTAMQPLAASFLAKNIDKHGGHLTTGFCGVGLICPVLTDHGYPELAHALVRKETYPSWGYSIHHGATTIWERWDGWTEERGFQTPVMNSFNHYSLGSVVSWLYEYVGGIRAVRDAPAYEHVLIAPVPGQLSSARTTYRSIRGTIVSDWTCDEHCFELMVQVPPNVTATVVLPSREGALSENSHAPAADRATLEDGRWKIEISSGAYAFRLATDAT